MDVSSEMIHGLLPIFLITVLHASPAMVGLIEGLGEATANVGKVVSGVLSDITRRRKPFAVLGYGLGALSKPLFALAPGAGWVLVARFSDRVGKGLRGAPRDALVAELAPPGMSGAAFGLRQSLDNVGAFVGPLLAMALMWLLSGDFRMIFWLAAIPGALAVLVLVLFVREPETRKVGPRPRIDRAALALLPRSYWLTLCAAAILTLARMSEAFVILRAEDLGLALALTPMVLIVINLVASALTYPLGVLSDRIGRFGLLTAGFCTLALSHVLLAVSPGLPMLFAATALWGLHLALSQGLLSALVADSAPEALRGTAFGLFNLATGASLFVASLGAGLLWQFFGPETTFGAGAVAALAGVFVFRLCLTPPDQST
jgi:MFS family permease